MRTQPQPPEYRRWYRQTHKKEIAEYARRYYQEHKQQHAKVVRRNRMKTRYGITLEQMTKLRRKQQYRCAICKKHVKLQIDHDHATGVIRGLLCRHCNTNLLGAARDSIATLKAAIRYLQTATKRKQDWIKKL